jgi:RNA polymerase sigma factor (sigma-70 family)
VEPLETNWTLIRSASSGSRDAREEFARSYAPVVRSCLAARWRGSTLESEIDDAVQEVMLACLGDERLLGRSDPSRPFRPFLFGVARTIALRFEQRRGRHAPELLDESRLSAQETRSSVAFDRAFAMQVLREANEVHRRAAHAAGGVQWRRVELLELRFQRELSIAQIAELWGEDAARVHHLYADAREDFRRALRDVVARRCAVASADLERECEWMLEVLQRRDG